MTQLEKARAFAALHRPGDPVVLYNIWDAGGAKAVARAVATGSWSVAAAHGYPDGEEAPLDLVLQIVSRIVRTVNLPVTVDFEAGYAADPGELGANVTRLIETGAVGVNLEDQVIGADKLYDVDMQTARIAAARSAAEAAGIPLYINARTDLFLKQPDRARHQALLAAAIEREAAYAAAGADGFFAPGLGSPDLIGALCEAAGSPVNILWSKGAPAPAALARLGVARISFGSGPFREASQRLSAACRAALAEDFGL